jgi:hypothetical protein
MDFSVCFLNLAGFLVETEYLSRYRGGPVLEELSAVLGRCREVYLQQSGRDGSRDCLCAAVGARV